MANEVDRETTPIELRSVETTATVTTLNPSTNYSFVVRGVFESGEGPNSNAVYEVTGE